MNKLNLTAFLVLTFSLAQGQAKNFIDLPYIEVNGSADTLLMPNEIFIRILISEKDTKDRVSIEDLEKRMVTALTTIGINVEKDLNMADMASNFKYYLLKNKDVVKSKSYILKVSNATIASQAFVKLEEQGISNTSIDKVQHSDIENIRNTMRTHAIENARTRAIILTKPLGQAVGQAIHIMDTEDYNQPLQGRTSGIQIRGLAYFSKNNGYDEPPKIEFEKIKVTVNINAKFALR